MVDLPAEMKSLAKLRSIILNHNRSLTLCRLLQPQMRCTPLISSVSGPGRLGTGTSRGHAFMCLSANDRFKSFPEVLYHIVSLETIMLGNNQVDGVDASGLMKLRSLSTLDLSNNDVLKVPPELGLCTSLRCVSKIDQQRSGTGSGVQLTRPRPVPQVSQSGGEPFPRSSSSYRGQRDGCGDGVPAQPHPCVRPLQRWRCRSQLLPPAP